MHKNTQISLYERLGSKYRLAIDLRILGYTYNRIAINPEINLKENTVRSWFTQKGICYQGYKELQEQRINEREDLFKNISIQLLDLAQKQVFQSQVFPSGVVCQNKNIRTTGLSQSFELIEALKDNNFDLVTPLEFESKFSE